MAFRSVARGIKIVALDGYQGYASGFAKRNHHYDPDYQAAINLWGQEVLKIAAEYKQQVGELLHTTRSVDSGEKDMNALRAKWGEMEMERLRDEAQRLGII